VVGARGGLKLKAALEQLGGEGVPAEARFHPAPRVVHGTQLRVESRRLRKVCARLVPPLSLAAEVAKRLPKQRVLRERLDAASQRRLGAAPAALELV